MQIDTLHQKGIGDLQSAVYVLAQTSPPPPIYTLEWYHFALWRLKSSWGCFIEKGGPPKGGGNILSREVQELSAPRPQRLLASAATIAFAVIEVACDFLQPESRKISGKNRATLAQKYASDPCPPHTRQKYEQISVQNMTPNASKQGKFGSLGAIFLFIFLPCMWGLGSQKESPLALRIFFSTRSGKKRN